MKNLVNMLFVIIVITITVSNVEAKKFDKKWVAKTDPVLAESVRVYHYWNSVGGMKSWFYRNRTLYVNPSKTSITIYKKENNKTTILRSLHPELSVWKEIDKAFKSKEEMDLNRLRGVLYYAKFLGDTIPENLEEVRAPFFQGLITDDFTTEISHSAFGEKISFKRIGVSLDKETSRLEGRDKIYHWGWFFVHEENQAFVNNYNKDPFIRAAGDTIKEIMYRYNDYLLSEFGKGVADNLSKVSLSEEKVYKNGTQDIEVTSGDVEHVGDSKNWHRMVINIDTRKVWCNDYDLGNGLKFSGWIFLDGKPESVASITERKQ